MTLITSDRDGCGVQNPQTRVKQGNRKRERERESVQANTRERFPCFARRDSSGRSVEISEVQTLTQRDFASGGSSPLSKHTLSAFQGCSYKQQSASVETISEPR